MGPDQIAPKDLAMLGGSAEKGLLHVFKESIDTAKYPSAWKVSNQWRLAAVLAVPV